MSSMLAALRTALSHPPCLEYGLLVLVLLAVFVTLAAISPPAMPTMAATLVASLAAMLGARWGRSDPGRNT